MPATVLLDRGSDKDYGICFYGLTASYEFVSLPEAMLMVSRGESGLDPAVAALANRVIVPTHLEVMVTLTCPYCPAMVHLGHQPRLFQERVTRSASATASQPGSHR